MDISSLSMSMSQIPLQNDIGVAVLKNILDLAQEGDSVKKLLEASVTPYLGQNFDISV